MHFTSSAALLAYTIGAAMAVAQYGGSSSSSSSSSLSTQTSTTSSTTSTSSSTAPSSTSSAQNYYYAKEENDSYQPKNGNGNYGSSNVVPSSTEKETQARPLAHVPVYTPPKYDGSNDKKADNDKTYIPSTKADNNTILYNHAAATAPGSIAITAAFAGIAALFI
jgi:hypothetical protein